MLRKVLVIDDAESVHALLRLHFQHEPLEIHSAFNGESGLIAVTALRPDLVLLDVDMPDIGGFEICRRLREDPFTMNVPIIFLTAAASIGEKVCGLEIGASDYITKPFDPAELRARVTASLRLKQRMDSLAQQRVSDFMGEPWRLRQAAEIA